MTRRGLASLVGGVLLGAVITAVGFAAARGPSGSAESAATALDRLSAQVASLESEIRALGEWKLEVLRGERSWTEGPSTQAPQPLFRPEQETLDQVLASLQVLRERIDTQSDEYRTALADLRAELETTVSGPEPMPGSLPETPPDLQALTRISDRSEDEVTEEHLLWTYDHVLETYGRPTRVQPNPSTSGGGIKFLYDLPSGGTCIFWFKGGKVVRVLP